MLQVVTTLEGVGVTHTKQYIFQACCKDVASTDLTVLFTTEAAMTQQCGILRLLRNSCHHHVCIRARAVVPVSEGADQADHLHYRGRCLAIYRDWHIIIRSSQVFLTTLFS